MCDGAATDKAIAVQVRWTVPKHAATGQAVTASRQLLAIFEREDM